ncbi:DDE-type integrase/transposase/recombinase, partial [Pseudomonas hunanensis]|uniref:DDE-type integrase/transposase/recombinase n=1 Tax=Pseudomonas hunanensis TaxID=1247546 RepID=UPI0030D6D91D
QREIEVSSEAIRGWIIKFGPLIAANLRRRRGPPTGRWRLDEMVVKIRGRRMFLWRAVDDEGEVLDVPQLNRDVIWFNRTNDVQIKALLQPGTSFGLTDLQFAVIEPPVDTLQLFTDNQGADNTGRWQGGAFYKRHGLFGVDDRLT